MPVQQLSFWDNEALERGYRSLAALKMDEALVQFNKALRAGIGEMDSVQKLIEACKYWKPFLIPAIEDTNVSQHIKLLQDNYLDYSFIPQMATFKKSLLLFIVDLLQNENNIDINDAEAAFDLLLEMRDFEKAEALASYGISQHLENRQWLYLLAQAQWLCGKRSEANYNYVILLRCYPNEVPVGRIENTKLKELIHSYGPAMAPAYGWLRNIVPFVPLPDAFKVCDEEHQKALESYRLLQQAERSLNNNDMKSCINYRKQLKLISPGLYDEYFRRLRQR